MLMGIALTAMDHSSSTYIPSHVQAVAFFFGIS
jgi:hypothetical protein